MNATPLTIESAAPRWNWLPARGTWGEVQLESLLEQILTTEQFAKNVATKDGSGERVEFDIEASQKGPRAYRVRPADS